MYQTSGSTTRAPTPHPNPDAHPDPDRHGKSGGGTSCPATATANISADCYQGHPGSVSVTAATGDTNPSGVDGNQIAQLTDGKYSALSRDQFRLRDPSQFDARVASGAAGGVSGLVEVVLDNPSNAPGRQLRGR